MKKVLLFFILSSYCALNSIAQNTITGTGAGNSTITGQENVLYGAYTGPLLTTGSANALIGNRAGNNISTGYANLFLGNAAGLYVTTGIHNVYIGNGSGGGFGDNNNMYLTNGKFNTFIGSQSGAKMQNGDGNTFIGISTNFNVGGTTPTRCDNCVLIGRVASQSTDNLSNAGFYKKWHIYLLRKKGRNKQSKRFQIYKSEWID